ncbi:hypothetical protein J4866_06530 [Prevotella denticola]|uniref:hypothetical protein n=1 Tax=Prevotella denticola TaxID=28129 RepID=UPI001BAD67A6|nr:hypothetical protein [Prevotella denticola]QUB92599.1 hypothetical protein J4866_06530 [Prevotella denticola]
MFDPKVYSSAAASLSGDYDVYSESLFSGITNYFYSPEDYHLQIIMLNVIRTEP